MKEIVFRRSHENMNRGNFNVVIENGPTISIGNGETKRVCIEKLPARIYAKQGWLKSRDVTIDHLTTEINFKSERVKSLIAPALGGLLGLTVLIPQHVIADSRIAKTMSITGLSIIMLWTVYMFFIRRNDWIIVDVKG